MKRSRLAILIGAPLVLIAGGLWLFRPMEPKVQAGDDARTGVGQIVSVDSMTVGYGQTPIWLETTGTVRAEFEAPIGTKVTGRIMDVLVRQGDFVRKGQPLVRLDARDLDAGISQANANLRAADVGYDSARVAVQMESSTSEARIAASQAQVAQSESALKEARAKLDLAQAGPRKQERTQASLAVVQAKANMTLAETTLHRYEDLVNEGAVSRQQYDQVKAQCEVAKAQYETAQQSQSMTDEGSRSEDIRAAQEGVRQADAALSQARAGLRQSQAAALQVNVRRQEVRGTQAQIGQSQSALQIARITRDYATIAAPFDGVVTARLVDPGAMASIGVALLKIQGGQTRLEAVVPESALRTVHVGATIPVILDALSGRATRGRVVEIASQGDPASHTFVVKVGLPGDSGARAGMFGRARFAIGNERRLLVPAQAVFEREGLHYIYVLDGNATARLRLVTVGDAVDEMLPVLSGLNAGEKIVVRGVEGLADGTKTNSK